MPATDSDANQPPGEGRDAGWMRRRGLDSRLRLGVRMIGDAFDAHTWVEPDDTPLAQTDLVHHAFETGTLDARSDDRSDPAP